MSTTDQPGTGAIVDALAQLWETIRKRRPGVPAVVIILNDLAAHRSAVAWGHRTFERTVVGEPDVELVISPEALVPSLGDTEHTLKILLHEAAHGLAHARGIQDTSRQGRYHNKRFKLIAEEVGLDVASDGPLGDGWIPVGLAAGTVQTYAEPLFTLAEAARQPWQWTSPLVPRAAKCHCEPPRYLHTDHNTLAVAAPVCPICRQPYQPAAE